MKVCITECLRIDRERERRECRRSARDLGPARDDYKRGLLVHDRDPRDIHQPVIERTSTSSRSRSNGRNWSATAWRSA